MATWSLLDDQDLGTKSSAVGFAVYDALGVRLGYVSGLVADEDDRIQMLKVSVTEWSEPTEYLVPTGAITLIDDAKKTVQLRDLTKGSIRRVCFQLTDGLPERRLLISLRRHFPPPRASVVERLGRVALSSRSQRDRPTWLRLSEMMRLSDISRSS